VGFVAGSSAILNGSSWHDNGETPTFWPLYQQQMYDFFFKEINNVTSVRHVEKESPEQNRNK
jgi:hypothetical protein